MIKEIESRDYIAKSKLGDLCINPYVGCEHACLYCYAYYMAKWSGHDFEPWGSFVDVKWTKKPINLKRIRGRDITIGTVTDPYQPCEGKYKVTRHILEELQGAECKIRIITKGSLVCRDIDLLKSLSETAEVTVMESINDTTEEVRRTMDCASPIHMRMAALEQLHESGIRTGVFIAPILPGISDWKGVIETVRGFTDEFWFETLSLGGNAEHKRQFLRWVLFKRKDLWDLYHSIYVGGNVEPISLLKKEIEQYCADAGIDGNFGGLAPHHLTY